jgi:polysaccharide export outer membrane protein
VNTKTWLQIVRGCLALTTLIAATAMGGCDANSFWDPSKTGRFITTPTPIPIPHRIDIIEEPETGWGQTSKPTPEDLIPSDLTYRLVPGDVVTVRIADLYGPEWTVSTRRVDASGNFRVPEIGDVGAGGLTAQELEDEVSRVLEAEVMTNPQVDVVIEDGGAFQYTIYGAVLAPGLYTLRDPGLRLLSALAIAGGVPGVVQKIYVIRTVNLTEDAKPAWERGGPRGAPEPDQPPVDIEELIESLGEGGGGGPSPVALRQDDEPLIDIDDLEPVRVPQEPAVDVDVIPGRQPGDDSTFVYDEESGQWIRVRSGAGPDETGYQPAPTVVDRIIEIDYQRLSKGDSVLNIVVRPFDQIYIEGLSGFVYIDGEIRRPGVYTLPPTGITLSRLVTTAGGLGPLAIPEKVDLTRIVGSNREASVRLDLGGIRRGTEPDVYLKPDDHIIIGTNWIATPLAVLRGGLRMTYGFGFVLDRNFGNDVFGPPPVDNRF